ncbi:hypothetical protein MTO96_010544 [Rhipicephalus appendiculatus]
MRDGYSLLRQRPELPASARNGRSAYRSHQRQLLRGNPPSTCIAGSGIPGSDSGAEYVLRGFAYLGKEGLLYTTTSLVRQGPTKA